jgi:hypothetical protein
MSGVDIDGQSYWKGSADAIRSYVGGRMPESAEKDVKIDCEVGGTPLVVASKEAIPEVYGCSPGPEMYCGWYCEFVLGSETWDCWKGDGKAFVQPLQ